MPREKEGFREQLADLKEFFGEKRLLTVRDVLRYTGIVDRRTAIKRFSIDPEMGITTVQLARKMCTP